MAGAEDALRALARDLFEEAVEGRVLELARQQDSLEEQKRHTGTSMLADAEDTGQLPSQIDDTKNRISDMTSGRHPAAPLWRQYANEGGGGAAEHLDVAREKLGEGKLADAYQHLHEAHRLGVEQVLPRAHSPEQQDNARAHLDRIQQHMERLDKVAGTSPDMTRRVLGTAGEQQNRAKDIQDRARHGALDAAEGANHQGVADHEATGLLGDADKAKVRKVLGDRQAEKDARAAAAGMRTPPAPQGAAAVHPQIGHHLARLPGSSISGHEMMNRAMPMPQEPQSPAVAELRQAGSKIDRLSNQLGRRRKQDLTDHLQAMRAIQAQRRGQPAEGEYTQLSDEELSARAGQSQDAVEQALRGGQATSQQHSLDGHGQVWSPERAALHKQIVDEFMAKQTDVPSRREALFLGGPPGVDRRGAAQGHHDLSQYAVLSPGDFQEELSQRGEAPAIEGASPGESSPLVHQEAEHLANLVAAELEARGKNIAWDTSMKDYDASAGRLQHLKEAGYHVKGMLADATPEDAGAQAGSSYRRGVEAHRQGKESHGGRHVPRHVILASEAEPGVSHSRQTMDKLEPDFSQPAPEGSAIPSAEDLRRRMQQGGQ